MVNGLIVVEASELQWMIMNQRCCHWQWFNSFLVVFGWQFSGGLGYDGQLMGVRMGERID